MWPWIISRNFQLQSHPQSRYAAWDLFAVGTPYVTWHGTSQCCLIVALQKIHLLGALLESTPLTASPTALYFSWPSLHFLSQLCLESAYCSNSVPCCSFCLSFFASLWSYTHPTPSYLLPPAHSSSKSLCLSLLQLTPFWFLSQGGGGVQPPPLLPLL